ELLQSNVFRPARTAQRKPALVIHVQTLDFHFRRNAPRIKRQWRHMGPIDGYAIANCLRVALDARKANLEGGLGRYGVYVVTFYGRRRCALACGLEGNDLKGNTEHLGDFFSQLAISADIIAAPAQAAADNL